MPLKVSIGLTTYRDLSDPGIGEAVFDAYRMIDKTIVPNRVQVWSKKYQIETAAEFSKHWITKVTSISRAKYGDGPIIDKAELRIGAAWKRVGKLSGQGQVHYRNERDTADTDGLIIEHNYSEKVDWLELFKSLSNIAQPSYGMLHIFTERERLRSNGIDRFEIFDRAFTGERHFTSWKTVLDTWRTPDSWQLAERRAYRFLPQLSWANVLGQEFDGQYDRAAVEKNSIPLDVGTKGVAFHITPSLSDVEKKAHEFEAKRDVLRAAFRPGFFRS